MDYRDNSYSGSEKGKNTRPAALKQSVEAVYKSATSCVKFTALSLNDDMTEELYLRYGRAIHTDKFHLLECLRLCTAVKKSFVQFAVQQHKMLQSRMRRIVGAV